MPKYKPLYSLYKGLRESKYDVPDSYVSFQKTLTQPGNAGAKSRRGLYQSLKDSNYDVPDTYEDFYKNLFVPVNSTTSRALKIGENPNTPTVNRYRQKMFDSVDPNKNGLNNLSNRAVGQAVRATNNVRKPVIAKVVNQKGKPTGKEFAITPAKTAEDLDREYAQETTKNWENELHDQMADADKDAAKISDMFKSFIGSTDEVGSVWGNMTRGGGIAGTPHSVTTNNGILENTEARQLLAAGDYNRKRRELLQLEQDSRLSKDTSLLGGVKKAYNDIKNGEFSKAGKDLVYGAGFDDHSFFRGMYDAAKDTGLLTGGASDLINAGSLLATKQDLDNGVHTEAGDMLMQQAVKNSDAQSQYGDNQGWMYTGGVITTNMAPFMVQIGSAGFSKGMSNAIGKVVQGAASKVALGTMEKATGMAGAHIANYIGKVTGLTTKAFGKAIQYGIVGAAQANTVGLGNVANDVINRYTGQVYQDEQGNYKFGTFDSDGNLVHEGGEDFLTAFVKGDAAQTIEFATELAGGGIDAAGTALKNFVTKGGKKIINKYNMENVSKVIDFLLNNKVSKNARYLKAGADRTLGKVELNSIVGESLEEELGIIANTVFTGDNKISDLWDEKQQSQIWGGMLLSIGLMKGAVVPFHAYNAKQYYSYKHKLDKADVNLSQLLGKEKWEELRNQIDATTNEDMPEMVNRINRDVALGKNRQPVREYIQNLLIMRGYDIGNMLAAKKAVEDKGEGVSVKNMEKNQAYQQGRDAYGYDTHEIQLDQEDKQKSLAQLIGISEQQLASMSDEELEALSGRDDNIDRAIYDYQLSTARYEGVIDNARDQIDLEVQRAAQAVDMYTDKSRNTIRNATIKATGGLEDYGVYIINGNIATHEDGSIDISNSDDMILYYDPTTNTVEHADATMFAELGSEENADEVRSQAMADAKEKAIKETTGIIDGVVEVGTQFKTVGADGTEHTYEVLADNGDGTAMITIDGNVPTELVNGESVNIPVSFEELQKMKDEYDQQRLQAAKAEREQMEKERAAKQTQETEQTQPSFDFNQILNDNGNVVLVDVLDEDGNTKYPNSKLFLIRDAGAKAKVVELKSDGTIVPHAVSKEDVATISSMSLDEYKQAMPESSMIEDNSGEIEAETPTIEGETAAPAEETAAPESAETPATEQTPAAPSITLEDGTIVPMLEDGNPDFSKLTAAQTAELYDTQFGEDADSIVSGYVSDAKKALDKASNMTVKGKTFVEQKAAKDAKEKAIADAQAAYDSAIAIRDAYNERQLAKVEDTAEGRKELIEKARRKFARLKSAVKDDAEAVSQIYRDTIGSLLHRLYDSTGIDVTDTTPITSEEYVASNLGAHSLNYEGTETSKGVKQETGLSREDFAKTQLLAADGKGTTIDALVHSLWENRPSNLESLDTQDIRNALIGVLNSGFKASEARNFVENIRIAQAENILEEQKRAQENADYAEQHKAEPEAELKAKSDEKAELKAKSEEKLDNESSNESNDLGNDLDNEKTNDKINDNINAPEVPEDATDENPLGLQLSEDKVPFEIEGGKSGETYDINDNEDRQRLINDNKVDDKDILDIDMPKHVHKAIKELCKKMGLKVQFLYMGARSNGWIENGTMYLALDTEKATQFVFGHEMTHAIKQKNPEAYKELVKVAMAVTTKKKFEEDLAKVYQNYHGISGYNNVDDYVEEVVADNLGKFINDFDLAQKFSLRLNHPILGTILHAIQKIKSLLYGDFYKSVDALERIVEKAYVETAKGQVTNSETGEDVSFSLRQKPEPKKKGVGYKVFVLKDGKLYPPMVANPDGAATPVGVWLDTSNRKLKPFADYAKVKFSLKSIPVRFEAGKKLSDEEKKEVLSTLKDAYKVNGVPYHIEETAGGKEKRVYEPTADSYVVSDITNRPLRYYITLPDGRVAHPTEVYPNISDNEVKSSATKQGLLDEEVDQIVSAAIGNMKDIADNAKAIEVLTELQNLPHETHDVGYGMNNAQSYNYKTGIFTSDAAQAIDYVVRRMRRKEDVPTEIPAALKKAVADSYGMVDNLIGGMSTTKFSLKKVNDDFNQRLEELVKNPNQKDKILRLGRSSSFLKVGGITDAEIELDFDKFIRKSGDKYKNNHPFAASDLINLPMALAEPIAVFNSTTANDHVVLTELQKDGKNFIVAVRAVEQHRKGGVVLEVNKITSLYPKEERGIVYWINNGRISNVDKEKALHFIEALQPHAGTTITDEELKSAANIINSFETTKGNGEKVDVEAPKTFEEFLNHSSLKFSIKNEQQRKAAENAYEYASKLRPNKSSQYALVDMSNPSSSPEYYEKKALADRWRRFYNKAVHNELDDVYKDAWGNYKLFDLDRPFADQVNEVKGDVPNEFNAPDVVANKNADNESGAEYHEYKQDEPSSITYKDRYKAFKQREANREKTAGLRKERKEVEDSYNSKSEQRLAYNKQLMKEYMDKHGLSSENDIPYDVWDNLRSKSFEKYQDELDSLFNKYKDLDKQIKAVAEPRFSLKDEKIKSVAEKFGVNEDDVAMYANAVERGSTADAARARANIKRYLLQANEDKISSFHELMKYTVPVNEALKENFGDLDAMIEERRKQIEAERNAMEAARKRAQEEEEKRQKHLDELSLIPTDELDKRYMDAIANNDESTAREMLDESARRKGYGDVDSDYQGQGAWAAPSNPQYESDEARRADIENSPDVNLEDIALGYSLQPDDYFDNPRAYMNNTAYGLESAHVIKNALDAIKNGEKDVKVKVYRAVPTSVKEGKLRNGDWVTPSKKYAEMHGDNRLEGKYRIIEDEVPANQLWWDGNDANEFGFDDGKEYRYKNAKNNRKLNDLITYDNKGNVIPPSKRFNSRKNDIRFSLKEEKKKIVADAKANGTYMTAPNGEKTKLDAEQWATVRTTNFKNWFGDWENDPENASKVVDENGEPMVVWHGRSAEFNTFEKKEGVRFIMGLEDKVKAEGFFFSPDKGLAEEFASNSSRHRGGKANVVPCFLNIRRPMDLTGEDYDRIYEDVTGWEYMVGMDTQDNLWGIMDEEGMADKIKEKGYDGAIFVEEVDDSYEPTKISYCALDANQIKSAENNNGDFSADNNDIRFSLKSMMAKPEGWKQANKKAIHIAEAIERDPKFSLKNLDGTLIKAGTYFSGGGLVEEGLKGIIDPVVAVEYDEKISGVYRNNFGQHIVTADVRDVDPKELVKQIDGEVEYFHASPVCKNYSRAKSNHAEVELDKETAASTAEFINAIKPKVVTIENVKGYKDSEAMKTITDALDANGYTWDADVYNAADYGGYTNRERLIVRAVRDGKLPEKPKKMVRKSGWYEAVADIIPTLTEKKNGVAPWMDIRLKADGIDWRNIDKPLYVMGSAYADGKVPHAFADELLPTLRTKSGDVIVMPNGKVYRAMGRVLARVSGVSDDYKMPFSENLSHTIIGNGIPTQLTEHVIAPLLQNTLRPTTPEDGNTKFSLRYDKFEHDLNQWKKDNNLPKDAQRPTIPQRNAGESAVDFLRRVDEYRKQMALWKTAPTYEHHLLSDDTALGEFNRELQRGSVLKRIAFQDSMLAIRKAQEAIMKEVGVDRLNMAEDAYTAENRSHGKGKNEFEEYNNEFLQPLRKAYHQMKKVLGDSYDNVRIYMMAKHGLERDAQVAFKKSLESDFDDVVKRSAAYRAYKGDMNRIINNSDLEYGRIDFKTWRNRDNLLRTKYSPSYMAYRYDENGIVFDYSGLSALFGGPDFEEAGHKLVRDIEDKYVTETHDLWDATNAATKKILRDGYKAGMMSKDTYQYVRDMYGHYIPLRGWDGTTADQVWDYVGGGKGSFNQTLKTAHGRTSIADDPIAYIENMAESGILLNNKNWVKQHLMLLAQNHPTSLLTLSKAWYVKSTDANGNEEWIPATPQITSQMNSNQVKATIDAFEKKMEQMAVTGDATQKRDGLNIAYPQTHSEEREHEVRVMKDGEEYVIYVNGDPQLAQAMNNTRAHRVREIQSGKLDRAAAWLGRKMAAAYTSLSPLFIPSNYFRDLTMTLASTAIREDGRYNYLLRKNMATSWNLGFMLRDYQNGKLRDKVNNGNATPKEQMFYDFMMNGGETGFVSSLDVEDLKKKFKNDLKDLDRWKTNPVKVGHTIMDGIEFLNRAIEDSNRFAVYMTSIQYGRSIDEAVNDAKDVTLNFNRKGTGEYGWQMIRNLYLFINPAVQSLQTLGALAKYHPFKFTAVTASWLASGVLVPIVNAALMSLLGGDDDKDKYWQFTKWDRRNNLIMWVPFTHEYIKIPLAQEFRAFYGIGDMIASKMMGGELAEESWSQYAEDLLGQVVDMLPLDPTGYDGNIAVSLMPNAIRPVFELAFNVDFTGKPLFKETEYNKYDPNFTKAYVGTPDWLVRASRMVNSIGNDYPDVQQNSIDAFGDPRYNLNNPAVVDHVLSSYLGGAYTMGSQVLGVLTKSLNDPKEIKVADIPLFSKFVSNPDDRPVTKKQGDEFWNMKENHDRAANTLSKLKKQAKVDGDYSMLERFYGSEEYKQYKQDDVKVKKYEEDKKKERAEESGEEYRPHKLNAEDIYKAHATPKDDFEDLKLKQLYTKLNGFKTSYDLLVDTAPSQSDGYYNTNKAAIDAIDEISLDKQEISELKKGFLDDGKDAYNSEDMKQIRDLRKKILAVLEKANKLVVANQKAKIEK